MKITVGGEKKEVPDGLTVAELIELEQVETPEYVTVVRGKVILPSLGKDLFTSVGKQFFT